MNAQSPCCTGYVNYFQGNWMIYNTKDVFRRKFGVENNWPVYEMRKYNSTNNSYQYYLFHLGGKWQLGGNYSLDIGHMFNRDNAANPTLVKNNWTIIGVNASDPIPMPTLRATIECGTSDPTSESVTRSSLI